MELLIERELSRSKTVEPCFFICRFPSGRATGNFGLSSFTPAPSGLPSYFSDASEVMLLMIAHVAHVDSEVHVSGVASCNIENTRNQTCASDSCVGLSGRSCTCTSAHAQPHAHAPRSRIFIH